MNDNRHVYPCVGVTLSRWGLGFRVYGLGHVLVDNLDSPGALFLKIRLISAARHAQVAELTRILEENELFQYPKEDDLIGPVTLSTTIITHSNAY